MDKDVHVGPKTNRPWNKDMSIGKSTGTDTPRSSQHAAEYDELTLDRLRNRLDVEASRSHVSRDEHLAAARLDRVPHAVAPDAYNPELALLLLKLAVTAGACRGVKMVSSWCFLGRPSFSSDGSIPVEA